MPTSRECYQALQENLVFLISLDPETCSFFTPLPPSPTYTSRFCKLARNDTQEKNTS